MTRRSPRKQVDALYWQARLRAADEFLGAAQQALVLAEPGRNCNPIVSQIALAAIAYGDSLTAKRAQVINQQDHAVAPRLLRDVLRNNLPEAQERRYRRILGYKDEVQYGTKAVSKELASKLLEDLEEFARWAREFL